MRKILAALLMTFAAVPAAADMADFDDLPLLPNSYWTGPDPLGTVVSGPYGPEVHGGFTSGGARFINRFDQTFESWGGFAYSNTTDTATPGFMNQYSAFTGTGAGPGADNYGVAFGYLDTQANMFQPFAFDPGNVAHLEQLPYLDLPTNMRIESALVTNTTYAALSMLHGDQFGKKFGGATGNDPDFFKLSAYGTDANGVPLPQSVDFYLADYRFADNNDDYLVDTWASWDLSILGDAARIYFNLSSSDSGDYGMNTPAYFAIDNIQLAPVPEPSSILLMFAATVGFFWFRSR